MIEHLRCTYCGAIVPLSQLVDVDVLGLEVLITMEDDEGEWWPKACPNCGFRYGQRCEMSVFGLLHETFQRSTVPHVPLRLRRAYWQWLLVEETQ